MPGTRRLRTTRTRPVAGRVGDVRQIRTRPARDLIGNSRISRSGPRDPAPPSDLLRRVGHTVHQIRRERGLSRRALAERSGVSARFLAQLESGTANISILRLDQLARALDVPLLQLLATRATREKLRVALLGLRGAGKSTIGPRLARRLGIPFLELDALIEEAGGLPSGQIFELHGERYFRRLERETVSRLVSESPMAVVATGGGLVTDPETFALLRETCTTVWLAAEPEDHYARVLAQGDRRPMADNPHAMADLRALLAARQPLYALADLKVDTSTTPLSDAVDTIAQYLQSSS